MPNEAVLGNMVIHITAEAEAFNKAVATTQQKVEGAGKNIESTGMKMLSFNAALQIGEKALQAVDKVIDETVNKAVAYNKQIREMMQLTGSTADETSRLVQVADDMGIKIPEAQSALEMMNKRGFTPSIENLAKLADEYVNAADKTAFIEEASKKYGRSFGTLIPMLVKGGDALRDQTAAVDKNLIATDESIARTREWEIQLDQLTDTITGLEMELGSGGLLQLLIDGAKALNNLVVAENRDIDVRRTSQQLVNAGIMTDKERLNLLWEILTGEKDKATAADELNTLYYNQIGYEEELNKVRSARASITDDTTKGEDDLADSLERGRETVGNFAYAIAAAEGTHRAWNDVMAASAKILDDLNLAINGRLGPTIEDFNKTQADLELQMKGVQSEIELAISQGYDPMSEKVSELKTKYEELGGQYDENATAHDEATKRILFDIIQQQAAMDGLTVSEVTVLTDLATRWGLVDEATADAMLTASGAFDYLATSGDVTGALTMLDKMDEATGATAEEAQNLADGVNNTADALDRLDGKNVSANIDITTSGAGVIGNVNLALQLQEGGDFWANQPTLLMVGEGGQREHVSVIPENRMGEGRGDTIIINDRLAYKMWKADRDRETRKRLEAIL